MELQEARLALVRELTQATIGLLAPDKQPDLAAELFSWLNRQRYIFLQEPKSFYLTVTAPQEPPIIPGQPPPQGQGAPEAATAGLDTTLVAGMFFQVLLEAEQLPATPVERTTYIKQAVKKFLVQRLAGQITLAQFFRLVQVIEQEVNYYFHRLPSNWLQPSKPATTDLSIPAAEPIQTARLSKALGNLPLPHQSNRKLSATGVAEFLMQTGGNWFRLLDFERHFRLNKKTAWSYLSLLLRHGILRHNQGKANRVRYALAAEFLQPGSESPTGG